MDLYLHTFAAKLRARNGLLEVHTYFNDGFAHGALPAQGKTSGKKTASASFTRHEFSPHVVKCVWLQQGTSVSTDAIILAMQHDIDLVFLDAFGHPIARVWRTAPCSTAALQRQQLAAATDKRALVYVRTWLLRKNQNQIALLEKLGAAAQKSLENNETTHKTNVVGKVHQAIARIKALTTQVAAVESDTLHEVADTLRGYEGAAARHYFQALSSLLPKAHRFAGRSQHPAADGFNAFLNYAYGKTQRRKAVY